LIVGTVFAALTLGAVIAYGDTVTVNDVVTGTDTSLTRGASSSGRLFIVATTGGSDANGCNATGVTPATAALTMSSGGSSSSSLSLVGCGATNTADIPYSVNSTATLGSLITATSNVSGGKAGSVYAQDSFTIRVLPRAASSLNASPNGQTQIDLTWTASPDASDITDYRIFEGTLEVATASKSVTAKSITGLLADSNHCYTIRARFNDGTTDFFSSAAGPACATTAAAPANTAPAVSLTGVTNGNSYEIGSVPAASCSVVDAEDGNSNFAATLSAITGPNAAYGVGSQTASCSYTDGGGLTGNASATYSIVDTQSPQLSTCDSADSDWHGDNVTLQCHYTDGGSGPATIDVDLSTGVADGAETSNASASAGGDQACDNVGNCAASPADITGNMIDRKNPELSTCDSADSDWHGDNVTVQCHYTDGGSGPATIDVDLSTGVADGAETSNASASAGGDQACDNVGNCAASPADITGNMIDRKAPELSSCDSADSAWHAANVTLQCHYTDGGSGPATINVDLSTNVAAGDETASAFASAGVAQACDAVNNCAATPADIGGNKIDRKAPSITLTTPPEGASYVLNQLVAAVYSCADGGSGYANCTGNVANGANMNTGSVGSKPFSVNSTDNVGNVATTVTHTYTVSYNFSGFFAPIDRPNTMNVSKAGQAIPLKWRLTDAGGNPVTNLAGATVSVSGVSCALGTTDDLIEEVAAGSSGLLNLGNGYYQINWKSPTSYAGSCKTVNLSLAGEAAPLTNLALISFKK
jgi:hypothetical protein